MIYYDSTTPINLICCCILKLTFKCAELPVRERLREVYNIFYNSRTFTFRFGVQANANTILIYVTLIPVAVKSIQFSPWLHFIAALYVCWLKNSCVI